MLNNVNHATWDVGGGGNILGKATWYGIHGASSMGIIMWNPHKVSSTEGCYLMHNEQRSSLKGLNSCLGGPASVPLQTNPGDNEDILKSQRHLNMKISFSMKITG